MSLKPPTSGNDPITDLQILDVHDFGARGDGVTDDSVAILAAIAALPTSAGRKSGKISFQPGSTYNISQTLALDSAGGVVLEGQGGTPGYPRLVWTGGAGSGPAIRVNSGFGVQIRDLIIGYTNAAFNGNLISTDSTGTDVSQLLIEGCFLGGLSGATGAASLVRLNKTIISCIRNNYFQNAAIGILKGANYVTTLSILDNGFANLTSSAIKNPDNCWRIQNNTFEPLVGGAGTAIDHTLDFWTTGLTLKGNYFADASVAGTWVKMRSSGGSIDANYMVIPTGGTGFYLERCFGTVFTAIDCQGGLYGIDFGNAGGNLNESVNVLGGQITSTTPLRNTGNCGNLEVRAVYPVTSVPPRGVNEGYVGVNSAATLVLPTTDQGGFWLISGTTTITGIPASWPGRLVTLVFASTAQVTDGGNLKLASNFTGAADRTLTLRCDGSNWLEVGRSTN